MASNAINDQRIDIPFNGDFSHTEDDCCCGFTVTVANGKKTHRVKFMRWWEGNSDGISCCLIIGLPWLIYYGAERLVLKCKDNADSTHAVHVLCGGDIERVEKVADGLDLYMKTPYHNGRCDVYQFRRVESVCVPPQTQNML